MLLMKRWETCEVNDNYDEGEESMNEFYLYYYDMDAG